MIDFIALAKRARQHIIDDAYLVSFMTQIEHKDQEPVWSVHYYDPVRDGMYTYDPQTEEVAGPSDVLKKEDFIPELDVQAVRISYEDAIRLAYEQALPETEFVRVIIILQHVDEEIIWNITFMNKQFYALNVRIDAVDASLIRKEAFQLFRPDQG